VVIVDKFLTPEEGTVVLEQGVDNVSAAIKWLALSYTAQQACGMAMLGDTRPQIAKKLGVTRQRVSQLVKMLHRKEVLGQDVLAENDNMARENWRLKRLRPDKRARSWLRRLRHDD
jgi:alkyl hydroperoxide reductase subunit AhpC